MKQQKYFPIFIAPWSVFDGGVKIDAITNSITLAGAEASDIELIEKTCSGTLDLDQVTKKNV